MIFEKACYLVAVLAAAAIFGGICFLAGVLHGERNAEKKKRLDTFAVQPVTNYDLLISKTPEELANWLYDVPGKWYARKEAWLDWLTQEADQCTT